MTALVFNTRRKVFADARVREALIYLFDFEWINRTLYAGLYSRTQSYFERSILASAGRPADAREREMLAPLPERGEVRPSWTAPTASHRPTARGRNRENQEQAFRLLQRGRLHAARTASSSMRDGHQLSFEILAASTSQEALLLSFARDVERLGIRGEAARRRRRAVSAAADETTTTT